MCSNGSVVKCWSAIQAIASTAAPEVATPNLANQTHRKFPDVIENDFVRYTLVSLHIAAILLALVGNSVLIYVLVRQQRLRRKVAVYLILNLAVCDLASTLIHQPMRIFDVIAPFVRKDKFFEHSLTFCRTNGFFASFFTAVAFHTIVAIGQERYLLICHPFKAKSILTAKRVRKILVIIWVLSFALSLPYSVVYTYVSNVMLHEVNMSFCLVDIFRDFNHGGRIYFQILFVIYFVAPVIVITYSYTRIFYTLNKTINGADSKDEAFQRTANSRKTLSKIMLVIAILFVVFHGPAWLTFLFITFGYKVQQSPITVLMIIEFLPILSAVANPFIYTFRVRNIKKELRSLLSRDTISVRGNTNLSTTNDTHRAQHRPVVEHPDNSDDSSGRDLKLSKLNTVPKTRKSIEYMPVCEDPDETN